MLSNSRNFVMEQPTLIDNSINTILHTGSPGLDKLRQHICVDAAHDSNMNHVNKPACSPVTRIRILQELADWMNNQNPTHRMIWLHGPAGAGKSAIAQSTMQRAVKDGRLAASFFFSRGAPGRSNAGHLFSTIAYQIALNIPELERPVEAIMRRHPELPSKSLEIQFRELIHIPARENNIPGYPVIGIDGIDECDDEDVQTAFLTIIAEAVISGQCPFRFLISSRPESHLLRLFTQIFHAHTQEIKLETSEEALDDIEVYFRAEFAEICKLRSSFMQHVSQPWPSNDDIWELRDRSSGHFIYAATVIKFVGGNKYQNPVNQLDIILRPAPETKLALKARPYSELDRLYVQVLSTHPDPAQLLEILKFLVSYSRHRQSELTLGLLDDLLGTQPGTAETSLSGIYSLVEFSTNTKFGATCETRTSIAFHHASFEEFLLNSSRSQHFHIDHDSSFLQVKKAYVDLLIQWITEADQDSVSELYVPIWANTILEGYWYSTRQFKFAYLCRYLKKCIVEPHDVDMFAHILRIIQCIPSKPGIPPTHMWFILYSLADMTDKWIENQSASIRLSHYTLMPLYRLHEAFESYLLNDNSRKLRFLLNLPGMTSPNYTHSINESLDRFLPIYIFSTIYCIKDGDLFMLIHESYPFLDFARGNHFSIRISSLFIKFLKQTLRMKHYLDNTGTTIMGKCLDYLYEIDLITKDGHLTRHPEAHNFKVLGWLVALGKMRYPNAYLSRGLLLSSTPNLEVLWGPSERPESAIFKKIKCQYSQLKFRGNSLTKEPTSSIRIHIHFLSLTPAECLDPTISCKDLDLSSISFPLMSNKCRTTVLGLNTLFCHSTSLNHEELVEEVNVSKGVLRWELNMLFEICEARKDKLVLIMHTSTVTKENKRLLKVLCSSSRIYKLRDTVLSSSEKLRGVYKARSTDMTRPFLLRRPSHFTS